MSLDGLLSAWGAEIVGHQRVDAWPGESVPLPGGLAAPLRQALEGAGIERLHLHQRDAIAASFRGESVLLTTGTASGKSLAYQLPALSMQLARPDATCLLLHPTKALAHDQAEAFTRLAVAAGLEPGSVASYDGDTPSGQRPLIRASARTLLTNPDMLNAGMLPHHTLWRRFLQGLSLIVVDEIHTYRGVFGSHVAGVLRRLVRLARYYGAEPRFIMTSATLGNPGEHARRICGQDVTVIERDTAPDPGRDWYLLQPPLVDKELGLRRPAAQEAMGVTERLVAAGKQVLLFCGSRQGVEEAVLGLRGRVPGVRAYRGGLLPAERREIEARLKDGSARAVVTTNALELGVDIGSVDAVVMAGHPGSAAAFRQQAGRSGRRDSPGIAVLVLGAGPLDQYLARHPQHLFGANPERALCDPDHLLIALDHLRCAAFELPVTAGECFGGFGPDEVAQLLGQLASDGEVHLAAGKGYWIGQDYPAQRISLRSAGNQQVLLQADGTTIGTVDAASARWLVFEGAVYVHDGTPWLVTGLDLEKSVATLEPTGSNYVTRATRDTGIEPADGPLVRQPAKGADVFSGEVLVTETVTGYRRMLRQTGETLGRYPLDLEPVTLYTVAYGFTPHESVVQQLRDSGSWNNDANDYGPDWPRIRRQVVMRDQERCQVCGTARSSGIPLHVHHKVPFRAFGSASQANRLENLITLCPSCHRRAEQGVKIRSGLSAVGHALGSLAPLLVMCDGRDLAVHADPTSPLAQGAPALTIYETVPGGVGLVDELAARHYELLAATRDLIADCGCPDGCPSCVGPAGEPGYAGKDEALALLGRLV